MLRSLRLMLAAALLGLSATGAVAADQPPRRTISVTGEGRVSATPDLAIVSFAVETTAPQAGAAIDDNARKSAAASAAVKERLEAKDKITTTGYSLDPYYEQRERGSGQPPKISGYIARNEVRVELHRIEAVGRLIDAATQAGANRVSGLQFTLENRAPQLREALQQAGREAQQQAESVAAALGVRLKQIVAATTSAGPIIMPRRYEGLAMAAAESRAPTPIEPGEVTVSATLQVTYEIE